MSIVSLPCQWFVHRGSGDDGGDRRWRRGRRWRWLRRRGAGARWRGRSSCGRTSRCGLYAIPSFTSFIHIIHLTILGGVLATMPGAGFHHHHNHHHHGAGGGIGAGGIVLVEEMDSDNDNDDFAGVPGPGYIVLLKWIWNVCFWLCNANGMQHSTPWTLTMMILTTWRTSTWCSSVKFHSMKMYMRWRFRVECKGSCEGWKHCVG